MKSRLIQIELCALLFCLPAYAMQFSDSTFTNSTWSKWPPAARAEAGQRWPLEKTRHEGQGHQLLCAVLMCW